MSSEVVRAGTPPNATALQAGQTSGPVVGQQWDPVIDHASFQPSSALDILFVTAAPANIDLGPSLGTILCDLSVPPISFVADTPGAPFAVAVPDLCEIVGTPLCAQGFSSDGVVNQLTNALDVVIGAY